MEPLGLANMYKVIILMDICTNYWANKVTKENVAELWVNAECFRADKLVKADYAF